MLHGIYLLWFTRSVMSNSFVTPSMDGSLPGSSVHGISQARILEWVAISFSRVIFLTQALNPMSSALAGGLVVKNPPAKAGDLRDTGLIPGSGRSPEGENGYPLQYSCLRNPMDRRDWRAVLHRIAESDTTEVI